MGIVETLFRALPWMLVCLFMFLQNHTDRSMRRRLEELEEKVDQLEGQGADSNDVSQ